MPEPVHVQIGAGKLGLGLIGDIAADLDLESVFLNRKHPNSDDRTRSLKIHGCYHLRGWDTQEPKVIRNFSLELFDEQNPESPAFQVIAQPSAALLAERQRMDETIEALKHDTGAVPVRLADFLELAGSAYLSYREALPHERRRLAEKLTSNRDADRKSLVVTLKSPFAEIANRFALSNSAPTRNRT